jgi:ABC-type nitrate/sulfonate/bicarbonate transport system substrate-binding protein
MLDQCLTVDQGFYRDEGLDVEIVVGTDHPGSSGGQMLANGDVDFAVAGSGIILPAVQRGTDEIKYVLFTRRDPPHRLVGRPHIRSAEDLRGRLIGVVPSGTVLYYLLIRKWLRSHGLDPDRDVRFLERDPESLRDFHLRSSDWAREAYLDAADAFVIYEVQRELYQKLGFNELMETYEEYRDSSTHGLATTRELIEEYPDLVRRMVKAHINAASYIGERDAEVIGYISTKWDVSEPVASRCYQSMKSVFIADINPERLRKEIQVMKNLEEVSSLPDFRPENFIEPKFARLYL